MTPNGPCVGCTVVAAKVYWDRFGRLATDGTTVVWFDTYDRTWMVGANGSNLRKFEIAGCDKSLRYPTIHGGLVYVTRFNGATQLMRFPLSAAAGTTCEAVLGGLRSPSTFFVDGSANAVFARTANLQRVDLATLQATSIPNLSFFEGSYADATSIFGSENSNGGSATNSIVLLERTAYARTVLASSVQNPNGLTLPPQVLFADASNVNFFSKAGLYRVARAGGTAVRLVGPENAWDMRLDGGDVVWYEFDRPNLYRMPVTGGPVTTITTGAYRVRGLTFDSTRYYIMETPQKVSYESDTWSLRAVPK